MRLLDQRLSDSIDSLAVRTSPIVAHRRFISFAGLPRSCSESFDSISHLDQKNICSLIRGLADSSYSRLLRKKREIEGLTDRTCHIHPLRFIEYIYKTPSLKSRMPKILDDSLGYKRKGFLNGYKHRKGLIQRMNEQMDAQNVLQFLPEFAQSLQISEISLVPFFYSRDWEGLLRHLLIVCL